MKLPIDHYLRQLDGAIDFDSLVGSAYSKRRFHRAATLFLRALKRRGVLSIDARIHSNLGGPAVRGEVTVSDPEHGVYAHLGLLLYVRGCDRSDVYGAGMRFPNVFCDNARQAYDAIVAHTRKAREAHNAQV